MATQPPTAGLGERLAEFRRLFELLQQFQTLIPILAEMLPWLLKLARCIESLDDRQRERLAEFLADDPNDQQQLAEAIKSL